jgi:hypothetical protein
MQGLLRLAGWGVAATAALLLVVIAANSNGGRERLSVAFAGVNGTRAAEEAKAAAAQAAHLARVAAVESENRRLTEIVRSLAGDRERLLSRMAMIERSLQDVTGSIKRQAAAAAPPAKPQPPPATIIAPPPKAAAAPPQTVAVSEPASVPALVPTPPEKPKRVASVPAATSVPELEAIQPRPAAGVDIGGATNFDGLRKLWTAVTSSHRALFEGLHPIVTVHENSKSRAAELRLVAGPLTDVDLASRICATLAAAKRHCRLVTFEGQPLALHAAEPPRRPVAKARPAVRAP